MGQKMKKIKRKELVRLNPLLDSMVRGPQVILPKDFGSILAYTGLGRESRVVEAGAGSGFLMIMLGNVCKKVYSYERNERFYKLAMKNLERSGLITSNEGFSVVAPIRIISPFST